MGGGCCEGKVGGATDKSTAARCGPVFFKCVPTQSTRLIFISEKLVLEKSESPLILFYFKKENKTRKKTLKK